MQSLSYALLLVMVWVAVPSALHAEPPRARTLSVETLPSGIVPAGTLLRAIAWTDAAGENVAAFWRREDRRRGHAWLRIDLWTRGSGGALRLVRSIKDAVLGCEFDITAALDEGAIGLTDLDGDGLAELTFAYRTACRSDVSPASRKLVMLEQGDKYILRGSELVDLGAGERAGGDKAPDAALRKRPRFGAHADAVWSTLTVPVIPGEE